MKFSRKKIKHKIQRLKSDENPPEASQTNVNEESNIFTKPEGSTGSERITARQMASPLAK